MIRFIVKTETACVIVIKARKSKKLSKDEYIFDLPKVGFKAATLCRNRHRSVLFLVASYLKCKRFF